MNFLNNTKINIYLFSIIALILSLLIILQIYLIYKKSHTIIQEKESFVSGLSSITAAEIPTPTAKAFNVDIKSSDYSYDQYAISQTRKLLTKNIADILVQQNIERMNLVSLWFEREKKAKAAVERAILDLAFAVKTMVFTSASLVSIDPVVVIKATAFQILATADVALKTQGVEDAKKVHKEISKILNEIKRYIKYASEMESSTLTIDSIYTNPSERAQLKKCNMIVPTPYPALSPP